MPVLPLGQFDIITRKPLHIGYCIDRLLSHKIELVDHLPRSLKYISVPVLTKMVIARQQINSHNMV